MKKMEKISFELKTKLVENELYIKLADFENVMKKILSVEKENEQLKEQLKTACTLSSQDGCLASDKYDLVVMENEQLKQQIEEMKCCTNCKHNECKCEDVVCKKENECWYDKAEEEHLFFEKVKLECWELADDKNICW